MRRFHRALCVFLLAVVAVPLSAQTVRTDSLYSESLGRTKKYNVLLPQNFDSSNSYPVLFLLHGWGGNYSNWVSLTHLKEYLGTMHLVVLMPDGENSWYVNSVTEAGGAFEDYITREIVTSLSGKIKIDTTRFAVGGLSMGGYGALVLGLRDRRFQFIAALSASLDVPDGISDLGKNGRAGLKPSLVKAFGPTPTLFWVEHNPIRLAAQLSPSTAPYFYLATGIQDEFAHRLTLYRAFSDTLGAHGIRYEYHETPGRHNWEYWDQEIQGVLNRLKQLWKL